MERDLDTFDRFVDEPKSGCAKGACDTPVQILSRESSNGKRELRTKIID
jgi:hypothetical protein